MVIIIIKMKTKMTKIGKKYALKRYDHFPIREVVCNLTRFLSHKNNEKSSSILLFYICLFMYSINIDDSMNRSLMINGETMEEMVGADTTLHISAAAR